MKHVITGMVMSGIAFMVIAAVMVISGRSVRKNELEKVLEHAAKYTIERLNKEECQEINREEFLEIFTENLSKGIESDSKISVSVMKADARKGILSVRAEEEFYNPMGRLERVRAERTVILENYSLAEKETYKITYRIGEMDYKVYTVTAGSFLPIPANLEGREVYWTDEEGNVVNISNMIADSNRIFVAK